jgi:CAAX protease family protein
MTMPDNPLSRRGTVDSPTVSGLSDVAMVKLPSNELPTPNRKKLILEVTAVFVIQLILIGILVQLDRMVGLAGNLHALVGVVFILIPMLVLDRQDRPYARYGISWGKPHVDLLLVVIAMAICFPLVVVGTHLAFQVIGPQIWGLKAVPSWHFAWPEGYPGLAFSHLVVVALPEEFFYRGYLLGRLDDIYKKRITILGAQIGWSLPIQAVLFALGHFLIDLNPGRLMVFFPALVFGWLRARRGTIGAPILFHAASNIFMETFRAGFGL